LTTKYDEYSHRLLGPKRPKSTALNSDIRRNA
jgi:hypothetical protein